MVQLLLILDKENEKEPLFQKLAKKYFFIIYNKDGDTTYFCTV